jgi:hypothetical protein
VKILLLLLFIFSSLASFVSSIALVGSLEDHGEDINYWCLNWYFWGYLKKYIAITKAKTGKIGIYFHLFVYSTVLSIALFLIFVWNTIEFG